MRCFALFAGLLAATIAPTRADDVCDEKLKAFNDMLMVSRFTPEGAAKMFAAKEAAQAHRKAGRMRECLRVLREAMGR